MERYINALAACSGYIVPHEISSTPIQAIPAGLCVEWLAARSGYIPPPELARPSGGQKIQRGDVFALGHHRIMCGDSTSADDVAALMGGELAALCFTSPPYLDQRTFLDEQRLRPPGSQAPASVEWYDPPTDFNALMRSVSDNLPMQGDGQILVNFGQVVKKGELVDYFSDWRAYMKAIGHKHINTYIFDKMMGKPFVVQRLIRQHEEIFHYAKKCRMPAKTVLKKYENVKNRKGCFHNRLQDGSIRKQKGDGEKSLATHRQHGSVFCVSPRAGEDRYRRSIHPAVFPLELCRRIIPIWTSKGDVCFEPFSGSGTMILACEELSRRCFGMELVPQYVELAISEWEKYTGKKAVRIS